MVPGGFGHSEFLDHFGMIEDKLINHERIMACLIGGGEIGDVRFSLRLGAYVLLRRFFDSCDRHRSRYSNRDQLSILPTTSLTFQTKQLPPGAVHIHRDPSRSTGPEHCTKALL